MGVMEAGSSSPLGAIGAVVSLALIVVLVLGRPQRHRDRRRAGSWNRAATVAVGSARLVLDRSRRDGEPVDVRTWIGPQSSSDPASVRRHRFHQSWYRSFVLGVPAGTGPQPGSVSPYGNMLTAEDGAAGRNFLNSEIQAVAEARIAQGGTVEPFRCRHNMLSSQPMCFNLFGPLARRPDLAAAFVSSVTGRTVEIEAAGVRIEDSPGHLDDRTGLDASIRYMTSDGERGVLGIETKLSEQFSAKEYALDSKPAYRRYSEGPGSPFAADRLDDLTDARWNQLWRNQMVCEAIKDDEQRDHAEQVVVFPDDMVDTAGLVDQYASLLSRRDAVRAMTLSAVLDVLGGAGDPGIREWLGAFRTRYVDLGLSSALYAAWLAGDAPFD